MKTKYLLSGFILFLLASCSLDKSPLSEYYLPIENKNDSIKYTTRTQIENIYKGLSNIIRDQEYWYQDCLLIGEAHADNAYGGTTGAEVIPFETNSIDATNSVLERDWNNYLKWVASATDVIVNIDAVPDKSLTDAEKKLWKAEAMVLRAMIWYDMARRWGSIPIVKTQPPSITAENVEEIYPLLFPESQPVEVVYENIISDLKEAVKFVNPASSTDKSVISKGVAYALLAKAYAEKPMQDYAKVIEYCDLTEAQGYSLESTYGDLFSMNEDVTDVKLRNSKESILEAQFFAGTAWVSWMFGRNLLNWDESFTWAKWVTPSRDLIKAFQKEGDTERMNQSIVYYSCGWSNYYPQDNYPFMYKFRSNSSNIIRLRFADIILLKAEALANQNKLSEAAVLVKKIRERAKLNELTAIQTSSKENILDAILNERRLELAFEGHRLYDLIRFGKLQTVMNSLNSRDEGRLKQVYPYQEYSDRLPIPQNAIDNNTNLKQNPGYE